MSILFETERLLIRPYTPDDAEEAFEIYNDPEVAHFIGGVVEESIETQRASLERINRRYEEAGGGFGYWAIVEKTGGRIVGTVILQPLPGWPEVEVGWHLARRAWGNGYATEAARGCLDYGFGTLGLTRIVAVVDPLNTRSLAVARRLGMKHEGIIRAYEKDLEFFSSKQGH
jgi:RimJ/RimL family protein N-acetyltransferase